MSNFREKDIQNAREYAARINYKLSEECFDPDFGFADHITEADKINYSNEQKQFAKEIEEGKHDHNFTIWQRMHYYLTGESVPLLPK